MPGWMHQSDAWLAGAGGLVALIGLLAAIRGWIGDRSRGRRRCPACWYDMAGTAGWRCPECGREARSEAALGRTRRWWGVASVGVIAAVLGAAGAAYPFAQSEDWRQWTPTTALIVLAPWIDGDSAEAGELCRRLRSREDADELDRPARGCAALWGWQAWLLAWEASAMIGDTAHEDRRQFAMNLLSSLGPAAEPALPYLLKRMRETPADQRLSGGDLDLVGRIGAPAWEAAPMILAQLKKEPSGPSRASAVRSAVLALGRIGPPASAALDTLADLLDRDGDPGVARAIGRIGPKGDRATDALIAALGSERAELRAAAGDSVGRHPEVLAAAVAKLGSRCREGRGKERMAGILGLTALGAGAGPAATALATALEDEDPMVRYAAARAMEGIGPALAKAPAEALAALERAREDEDSLVRDAARAAMNRAAGRE